MVIAFISSTVALPLVIDRVFVTTLGGARATLVFPVALVAAEFLRSRFAPGATWGSVAYTQYGYLPLMQTAALVGIWGITFLVAWFASTFELAWSSGFDWAVVRNPILIFAGVLALVVAAGTVRLASAPASRASIRTAMLNRPGNLFVPGELTRIAEGRLSAGERAAVAPKLGRLHDALLEDSRREARAGARLVVWPEANLLVFKEDEAAFLGRAQRLAAEERIYLAMGMGAVQNGAPLPFENELVLVDPSGRVRLSYTKSHPVAGWEAGIMRVGDGRLPVASTADGRIAGAICYDGDFPEFVRQVSAESADILILPANDWTAIKDLHFQMHAFRAIENGVPLVRATSTGLAGAFDARGRVLGVADHSTAGDRALVAQVPVGSIRTLYSKIGDLFAWLCVVATIATLLIGLAGDAPPLRKGSTVLSRRA